MNSGYWECVGILMIVRLFLVIRFADVSLLNPFSRILCAAVSVGASQLLGLIR